jgi:cbb3-type cytochrome oxidase subunit 3
MIDNRIIFLALTALLLAILTVIVVVTYRKKRKQNLEEPKYRMLDDD